MHKSKARRWEGWKGGIDLRKEERARRSTLYWCKETPVRKYSENLSEIIWTSCLWWSLIQRRFVGGKGSGYVVPPLLTPEPPPPHTFFSSHLYCEYSLYRHFITNETSFSTTYIIWVDISIMSCADYSAFSSLSAFGFEKDQVGGVSPRGGGTPYLRPLPPTNRRCINDHQRQDVHINSDKESVYFRTWISLQ